MKAFENERGKLSAADLNRTVLSRKGRFRPEVLRGPAYGVDTAQIKLDNGLVLLSSSDPLSLIPSLGLKASAWLSVQLLVNDMATSGLAPQYAQFVLNLPTSLSAEEFDVYWQYIHEFCQQVGVAITGGHTGQVPGQNSTVCGGGTMFLTAPERQVLASSGAQAGDLVIMSKSAGLAASSILALSFEESLTGYLAAQQLEQAQANFYKTSSLTEALLASQCLQPNQQLTAMHDVTEGGVVGALQELAAASNCSYYLDYDKITVWPEVEAVCRVFKIEPQLCVGAGSMLMAVKPGNQERLLATLRKEQVDAQVIGFLTPNSEKNLMLKNGAEQIAPGISEDPYWNAYFSAYQAEWK